MSRRRDPLPLAEALGELTEQLQPATPLAAVQRRWEAAVGPTVASWCHPASERDGVVTVDCRDAVTAHELTMQQPAVLAALRHVLGDAAPHELRFRVR